jgi:hypothetical protein
LHLTYLTFKPPLKAQHPEEPPVPERIKRPFPFSSILLPFVLYSAATTTQQSRKSGKIRQFELDGVPYATYFPATLAEGRKPIFALFCAFLLKHCRKETGHRTCMGWGALAPVIPLFVVGPGLNDLGLMPF